MEECKGCLGLGHKGSCLNVVESRITETNRCPCMNCIVKMICRTQCNDFKVFLGINGPKWFKGKYTFRWRKTNEGV